MNLEGGFNLKRRVLLYLIVLIPLTLSLMAIAETSNAVNVGGDLEGMHIWKPSASPYHVVDDVRVRDGASLRINPGVAVVFTGDFKITCEGDANISAIGTDEDHISFYSLRPVDYYYEHIETGRSGTFSNCSFMNADICLMADQGAEIVDCNFSEARVGISINGSSVRISDCEVVGTETGVMMSGTSNSLVRNVTIRNVETGVFFGGVTEHAAVIGCTMFNCNSSGIEYRTHGASNEVRNNVLFSSRRGIYIIFGGSYSFFNNTLRSCGYGLDMTDTHNTMASPGMVQRCRIEDCTIGVEAWTSSWVLLFENTFRENAAAISTRYKIENVTIWRNNFLWNRAIFEYRQEPSINWSKGGYGNYWTGYDGTDGDADGVGDTPYEISTGNVDQHPLMLPVDFEDPRANAGPDVTIDQHEEMVFDGSDSGDDTFLENWTWEVTCDGSPTFLYGDSPALVFDEAGYYTATLTVTDAVGRTASDVMRLTVLDTEPPQFLGIDVPERVNTGDTINFTCQVVDNLGVVEVWVLYRWEGGAGERLVLTPEKDDCYFAEVPVPRDSVRPLHYSMGANDTAMNIRNFPYRTITVIDNIPPALVPGMIVDPTTGDVLHLNCTVEDNIGVRNTTVDYWLIGENITTLPLHETDGTWAGEATMPSSRTGEICVRFHTQDLQGNPVSSRPLSLWLRDDDLPVVVSHSIKPDGNELRKGDVLNVTVEVVDNIEVFFVLLEFKYYGTSWEELELFAENGSYRGTVNVSEELGNRLWYRFRCTDGAGNEAVTEEHEVVLLSRPPTIAIDFPEVIFEGHPFSISLTAQDPDTPPGASIWRVKTNARWLIHDVENATLHGFPTVDDLGSYWVNITVDDGDGGVDWKRFQFRVVDFDHPPTVEILFPEDGHLLSERTTIGGQASDDDGVVWVRLRIDGGGWIDAEGTSAWSYVLDPSRLGPGNHTIEVIAHDGHNESMVALITVQVPSEDGETPIPSYVILASFVSVTVVVLLLYMYVKSRRPS